MGGIIAVTVRYTDGEEWRGSMWTNVLPQGLFDVPFYNEQKSEAHVKNFITRLMANRAENPDLEDLWGDHNMLAPVEYGIVVVDFKTKTVVNHQGYCSVLNRYYMKETSDAVPKDYRAAGARVVLTRKLGNMQHFNVESFWKVADSLDTSPVTKQIIQALGFKFSKAETKCWREYLKHRLKEN